jgi:hypothetical protein
VLGEIELFVRLKYEIPIRFDLSSHSFFDAYPAEVNKKWAWRCVTDAEYLASGYPEAEECIRLAKAYRDGLATKDELAKAWLITSNPGALSAYYTAIGDYGSGANFAAGNRDPENLWKLYIKWLIEELYEWEINQ